MASLSIPGRRVAASKNRGRRNSEKHLSIRKKKEIVI
jgi:hypothetical protein